MFFIRRIQKVGQKGRGTDFWPGHPVRRPMEAILTVGKKMGGRRLNARGAFAFLFVMFQRSRRICAYYSNVSEFEGHLRLL